MNYCFNRAKYMKITEKLTKIGDFLTIKKYK